MNKKTGLWIDHREAVIVELTDKGEQITRIKSDAEKQIRFPGGSRKDGMQTTEAIRGKKLDTHLGKYFDNIIALTERVRHVVQSTFNGRRIVIFSGGAKTDDTAILNEVRAIRDGGGFGSIIGRNSFQRERTAALSLLDKMIHIYKGETP